MIVLQKVIYDQKFHRYSYEFLVHGEEYSVMITAEMVKTLSKEELHHAVMGIVVRKVQFQAQMMCDKIDLDTFPIESKENFKVVKFPVKALDLKAKPFYQDLSEDFHQHFSIAAPAPEAASQSVVQSLSNAIPNLKIKMVCPAEDNDLGNCEESQEIAWIIVHLNDGHKWTRETIADWLDTLDVELKF